MRCHKINGTTINQVHSQGMRYLSKQLLFDCIESEDETAKWFTSINYFDADFTIHERNNE